MNNAIKKVNIPTPHPTPHPKKKKQKKIHNGNITKSCGMLSNKLNGSWQFNIT